jgi:hypothetical protein
MKRLIRKTAVKTVTVEQLFKEKYPQGTITKKKGSYWITFNPNEKTYTYKASNNIDLIKKLKLSNANLMYQYDYNTYMEELNNQQQKLENLQNGVREENPFFDDEDTDIEQQKEYCQKEIDHFTQKLDNAVIVQ